MVSVVTQEIKKEMEVIFAIPGTNLVSVVTDSASCGVKAKEI